MAQLDDYIVTPDPNQQGWSVWHEGMQQPYFIEHQDDKWTCICPHFLHRLRRDGGHCKHINLVKERYSQ